VFRGNRHRFIIPAVSFGALAVNAYFAKMCILRSEFWTNLFGLQLSTESSFWPLFFLSATSLATVYWCTALSKSYPAEVVWVDETKAKLGFTNPLIGKVYYQTYQWKDIGPIEEDVEKFEYEEYSAKDKKKKKKKLPWWKFGMDWWKFKVSDRKMKMRLVGDVHNAALLNKILGYPPNFITEKEKTQDKKTDKESTKEKAQDPNKESTNAVTKKNEIH